MTQQTPDARPKPDIRQILWTIATAAPLAAAAGILSFAVDTAEAGKSGLGSALTALVTGADSADAHIVSMPWLWVARILIVASIVLFVFTVRYIVKRGQAARAQETPTS
jgi:hypothetical protein